MKFEPPCLIYNALDEVDFGDGIVLTKGQDYCVVRREVEDESQFVSIIELDLEDHSQKSIDLMISELNFDKDIQTGDAVIPFTLVDVVDRTTLLCKTIPGQDPIRIDLGFEVFIRS